MPHWPQVYPMTPPAGKVQTALGLNMVSKGLEAYPDRTSSLQESVLQGTGAKQDLPASTPQMGLGASAAPQDTTVLKVLSTSMAP